MPLQGILMTTRYSKSSPLQMRPWTMLQNLETRVTILASFTFAVLKPGQNSTTIFDGGVASVPAAPVRITQDRLKKRLDTLSKTLKRRELYFSVRSLSGRGLGSLWSTTCVRNMSLLRSKGLKNGYETNTLGWKSTLNASPQS